MVVLCYDALVAPMFIVVQALWLVMGPIVPSTKSTG